MLTVAVVAVIVIAFTSLVMKMYDQMYAKPHRVRSKLLKQGIKGPEPSFLLGNIAEMRRSQAKTSKSPPIPGRVSHEWAHSLFPFLNDWSRRFGMDGMLSFMLGNILVLFVEDHELVKEISVCTSLNLGKPSYLQKERGPLLGQGILSSNGPLWVYQRKIMSPELYMDKIKGMYGIMIESAHELASCWEKQIIDGSDEGDIRIDLDMRNFSADVISKACFGSSYTEGRHIFLKLRALQRIMSNKSMLLGLPGLKYIPVKSNRELWKLEKEIKTLILNVAEERKKLGINSTRDLLQIIIEGAENSDLSAEDKAKFIVDNAKTVYFAGHETTAMSACWTLLLLASSPEWQARVRDEVIEVCAGRDPDADMVNKMKLLRMVINESLRLYPTVVFLSREALEDMKFGKLFVPKGVNIWVPVVSLHRDTSVWGSDADEFKPERFTDGVAGACKVPQLYQPFGAGPRICAGLNLAIVELKIAMAILLTKFSFSVSPTYRHSPTFNLVIEPGQGINLVMKKI